MKQADPRAKSRSLHAICSFLLYVVFGGTVALLVLMIAFCLFGPDGNRLEEMALQSSGEHGIRQELLLKAAIAWNQLFVGVNHPVVAHALEDLADYYQEIDRFDRAEPLLLRAVAIEESCYSGNRVMKDRRITFNLDYLDCMDRLTRLYLKQGKYHEAAAMLRRECSLMLNTKRTPLEYLNQFKQQVLRVARHVPQQELPPLRVHFRTQITGVHLAKEALAASTLRDNSAEHLHRLAVTKLQIIYELFAWFEQQSKRSDEAEDFLRKAIALARKEDSQSTGWDAYLLELAVIRDIKGDHKQAEDCYKSLLASKETTGSDNSLNHIIALRNYGDFERRLGRAQEAQVIDARADQLLSPANQ